MSFDSGDKVTVGVVDAGDKSSPSRNMKKKTFWFNIFLIYRHCCWHWWFPFTDEYLLKFSYKFEIALMGTQGHVGNWFMKKIEAENLVSISL